MKQAERDNEELGIIVEYCDRIFASVERFGASYEAFAADFAYQDCCAMNIIQIGEAVYRISDEFKQEHTEIPWHNIYGMRCRITHAYADFDPELVWETMQDDIPALAAFCKKNFVEEM